jgi:hypothetical protein
MNNTPSNTASSSVQSIFPINWQSTVRVVAVVWKALTKTKRGGNAFGTVFISLVIGYVCWRFPLDWQYALKYGISLVNRLPLTLIPYLYIHMITDDATED